MINHQATFIPTQLFIDYGYYDETYKIHSDWFFFLKIAYLHQAVFTYLDCVITNYDTMGISSQKSNSKLQIEEQKRIFYQLFEKNAPFFLELKKFSLWANN